MDFSEKNCFVVAADVNSTIVSGEAALLNVRTGAYFGLNPVGTFIWQLYGEGKSYADVLPAICQEFSVDPAVAAADAEAFTRKMLDLGLLQIR